MFFRHLSGNENDNPAESAAESANIIEGTEDDVAQEEDVAQRADAPTCIFCDKKRKKVKGREESLSIFKNNGLETIKNMASTINDLNMQRKIEDLLSDQITVFHKSCKTRYYHSYVKLSYQKMKKNRTGTS